MCNDEKWDNTTGKTVLGYTKANAVEQGGCRMQSKALLLGTTETHIKGTVRTPSSRLLHRSSLLFYCEFSRSLARVLLGFLPIQNVCNIMALIMGALSVV